jgi:hypothetical protein
MHFRHGKPVVVAAVSLCASGSPLGNFPSPDESSRSKNLSLSGSSVSIRPGLRRTGSPDGAPR